MLFKDFSAIHRRADGHTLLKRCVDASNNYLLRRFTFHSLKLWIYESSLLILSCSRRDPWFPVVMSEMNNIIINHVIVSLS